MPSLKTVFVGMVTAGAVVVGGGTAVAMFSGSPGSDQATVLKVIDGDTLDVSYDDSVHRVRLLNVDAPETKHPDKDAECLGVEATQHLEQLLEPGDVVRLEFDVERLDSYSRELAGVYEGETLINAEVARRGLGVPMLIEPNRKFYPEVVAAYEEAKASGVGLFSADVDCTLPAKAEQYAVLVAELESGGSSDEVAAAADQVVEDGDALLAVIAGASVGTVAAVGMTAPELEALQVEVTALQERARTAGTDARAEIELAEKKAEEEAERKAAEEKAKKEAERKEAAEKKAKEEAEEKAKEEAETKAAEEEAARKAAEEEEARQAAAEAERQAAEQAERDRQAAQPPVQPQPFMPQPPATPPPAAPPVLPYPNCAAARAAGAAPVLIGTPGYGKHLDRDGDGIGCE